MPLQDSQPPIAPEPSGGVDPDYGFIFNDQQKSKKLLRLQLPGSSKLTKITLAVVGGGVILGILIIVLSSVFGAKGVNTKQLVDVMARAKEISRVSDLISQQQNNADANSLNLAATSSNALTSEQVQLSEYLAKHHVKANVKALNYYLNKNTDTQLQTAAQTNTLATTYYSYLKTNLADYQNDIKTIYSASPKSVQPILNDADSSAQTILAAPQLASVSTQ